MENILSIHKILSKHQSFPLAGKEVFDFVSSMPPTEPPVVLDMAGVTSVSTVFLNASLGKLIDTFGLETARSRIAFVNITRPQFERIRKYFADYAEILEKQNNQV